MILLPGLVPAPAWGVTSPANSPSIETPVHPAEKIKLQFFWSLTCPHCRKAKPFIEDLTRSYEWLELESYELSENEENVKRFLRVASQMGHEKLGVPAFAFCDQFIMGFHDTGTTGSLLRDRLFKCRMNMNGNTGNPAPVNTVPLPFEGKLDTSQYSLPTLTLILAGLDSFNPCAFFVLLFLLSLMVNARSRPRMLLVGGIFVLFSGLVYFAFMAAWLNLFLYLGEIRVVTIVTAVVAIGVATINIKDYFFFREGVSLSIPESAKAGLYGRIRNLIQAPRIPVLVFGTVILAIVANSYELLCTSGFPMVFTRILTLNQLSSAESYLYLALYNVIYVIPLAVIVIIFSITLGSRKLTEKEGRILKLVSGMMMLGLGLVLLIDPELLTRIEASVTLIVGALSLSGAIVWAEKFSNPHHT